MKYLGKITDNKDLVTKEYVDAYHKGENLIKVREVVRGVWVQNNGVEATSSLTISTGFIPVKPGDKIHLQYWQPANTATGNSRAWSGSPLYFNANKEYVSGYTSTYFTDEHKVFTETVPANCYYVRATYQFPQPLPVTVTDWTNSDLSGLKWKFEIGSEPTDWSPAEEDDTITLVKGAADTNYKQGKVNLAPSNIGAVAKNQNNTVYNSLTQAYRGGDGTNVYWKIHLPGAASTWNMLNMHVTLMQAHTGGYGGTIIITAYHNASSTAWTDFHAYAVGRFNKTIKVYGAEGADFYISGHGQYTSIEVSKLLIADYARGVDLSAVTITAVSSLPTTYQTATVYYTRYDTESIPEAYLSWGGKNFTGAYGCIDGAMVPELGANRLALPNASGITCEYSTDGGETWVDYGATDDNKRALFSEIGSGFYTGKSSSASTISINNRLRVTLTFPAAGVYTALNKFIFYVTTNGSSNCWCTIEAARKSDETTFITFANKVLISGWSGYNVINTSAITTYANNNSQFSIVRFIFGYDTISSTSYSGLLIQKIFGFGGVGWTQPNNLSKFGRIYSYDTNLNVTFPKNVTATSQLRMSSKNLVAMGSFGSTKTTIPDLCEELRYSSGCCGSFNLGTAYTLNNVTLTTGWYHFLWIPHGSGGTNWAAAAGGDNTNYGSLFLTGLNHSHGKLWLINYQSQVSKLILLSSDLANMTGTLGADHGGTGQTTLQNSANALINALSEGTSTPQNNDYFVSQYAGGSATTFHRRPVSALWEYIKGKISSVLGLTATSYGGNSATATKATQDGSGNTITSYYAPKSTTVTNVAYDGTKLTKTINGTTSDVVTVLNLRQDLSIPDAVDISYDSTNKKIIKTVNGTPADVVTVATLTSGLVPTTRKVNNKALSADITLSASDVSAVPTTRKVNNKALSADITLSASDVSAVPTTRTVNNKALSADITLTASDVGAVSTVSTTHNGCLAKFYSDGVLLDGPTLGSSTTTFLRNDGTWATPPSSGSIPNDYLKGTGLANACLTVENGDGTIDSDVVTADRRINNKNLYNDITLSASDVGALSSMNYTTVTTTSKSVSSSTSYSTFKGVQVAPGLHFFQASCSFQQSSNANRRGGLRLVSGSGTTAIAGMETKLTLSNNGETIAHISGWVQPTSTTTYNFQVFQNSGAALTLELVSRYHTLA